MRRAITFLTNCLIYIAAATLLAMMLHVALDVAGKYLLRSPIPGTAEIVASYYMIAAVFLPLAYMEITDQPIVADLLYQLSPSSMKFGLLIAAHCASICFYLLLAWYSLDVAIGAYEIGEYAVAFGKVITWPSKFILPLGLAVASLALCFKVFDLILTGPDAILPADHGAPGDEWIT